jgi:hypothetical protein
MPSPVPGHAERLRALLAAEQRATSPRPFRCDVRRDGDTVTLIPVGALHAGTSPLLEAELRAAFAHGGRTAVIDLRGLGVLGSAGVEALIRAAVPAAGPGRALHVIPGPDGVELAERLRRALALLGFAEPREGEEVRVARVGARSTGARRVAGQSPRAARSAG